MVFTSTFQLQPASLNKGGNSCKGIQEGYACWQLQLSLNEYQCQPRMYTSFAGRSVGSLRAKSRSTTTNIKYTLENVTNRGFQCLPLALPCIDSQN